MFVRTTCEGIVSLLDRVRQHCDEIEGCTRLQQWEPCEEKHCEHLELLGVRNSTAKTIGRLQVQALNMTYVGVLMI